MASIVTDQNEIKRIYEELGDNAIEMTQPEIDEINAKIYNYSFLFLKRND
jgi:hypothetical protein